jgi:REP element-mobilizing transposase RayT
MTRRRPAQLSLSLPAPRRWGGSRPGAGRKAGPRPVVRHGRRAHFAKPLPAHVTLRIRRDAPSLRTVRIVHELERTFAAGCERPGFRLVHYSLQGNHAHLIVEAHDRAALGRGMKSLGARLARAVNRIARRRGRVLADRYHVRMLPTPREVHRALRYVLLNARRHASSARTALARAVRLDPASSARWFDGWKRERLKEAVREELTAADGRPAVARAKTWLLTVGWRRHGLLDPTDVPG